MTATTRRTLESVTAVAGLLAVAILLGANELFPRANPHAPFQVSANCPRCHLVVKSKVDPDRFSTDADAYCRDCHRRETLGRTHPVGARPSDKYWKMKIPDEFRLDDDGRMMCLTCHRAHGPSLATVKSHPTQKPEKAGLAPAGNLYKTFFLRVSSPVDGFAALCDACHKKL